MLETYPEIDLVKYSDASTRWQEGRAALVIAAPLTAEEVSRWVSSQAATFTKCLDLRGEAASDPVSSDGDVIKLNELFEALRAERERLEGHVEAARADIKQLVQRQSQQAQFRPFGWEDLCA